MHIKQYKEEAHGPRMLHSTRREASDSRRMDPPEDRVAMTKTPVKSALRPSPAPSSHHSSLSDPKYLSASHPILQHNQSAFDPPTIVASRDDDSTSLRRKEIQSKIEALNAKSRELRSISFNAHPLTKSSSPYTYNDSSNFAMSSPPSTSSSPTSVTASSLYRSPPTQSNSGTLIDNILQSQKLTDAAIDSRLEFLRKQSLAWKKSNATPFSQASKRVTFEAERDAISNTSRTPYAEPRNHFSSSSAASATSQTGIAPLTSTPSFTSAISSTTGVTTATPDGPAIAPSSSTKYSSKSLAMKIVCEKILDGWTMTRKHCPNCTMALMRSNTSGTAPNNDGATQCVYCPIAAIRNKISPNICIRVMAATFSSGSKADTASGRSPCESCSSPILLNSQGAVMECSVCPVLDAACIAISREKERGGIFSDSRTCIECGSPEMTQSNGLSKCVVCDTLRIRLGEVLPTNPVQQEQTVSPKIKSNDPPLDHAKVNLAKLQEELEEELAKAAISQQSLMSRFQRIDQAEDSAKQEHEIIESHSIVMGNESASVDFNMLQNQLRTAVDQNSSSSGLAQFQDQLQAELSRTIEAQASLLHSLHDSRCSSSNISRDEIEAELTNAKQHQVTLEKIIEGTNIIEMATSNDPEFAGGLTDLLTTIAPGNLSYSISQQEVDATGNVKEYIPPPTFFRHSIPKEVIVYHIPEEHECDPSVAAQSHHTHNLKQTERSPPLPQQSSIFDCCGSTPAGADKKEDNAQPQDEDIYDYDTIETDDEYTVDYTLNTVDYGRLEYLRAMDESRFDYNMRSSHSRASGSVASVQNDKYQDNMENNMTEAKQQELKPPVSSGRCIFWCFGCGGEDDAHSTVESSKRGLTMKQDDDHRQHSAQNRHNIDSYHGQDDESVQLVRSPSPFSYYDSVNNESDFGSVNRVSRNPVKTQPKSSLRYPDPPTDQYSVQSDITDHSNVNRRVTFETSCRPREREYSELRALTEESDQWDVNDGYSLESVGSALSYQRVDMK